MRRIVDHQIVLEVHRDERGSVNLARIGAALRPIGYSIGRVRQSKGEAFPLLVCSPDQPASA